MGRIAVRVQPGARRDEVAGERAGALLVRVTAPPVEGKANEAVCRLLAARLGIRPRDVSVVHGTSSRDKLIEVEGVDTDLLRRELGLS